MTEPPALLTERMWGVLADKLPDRLPAELCIQVEECLKFLTIASERAASFFPLDAAVDEVWHELITETREYQGLCSRLPGGRFLHHSAITLDEYVQRSNRSAVVCELLEWIPVYVRTFGDFTPEAAEYWVICRFLRAELGLSLDDINRIGRESRTGEQSVSADIR